MRAVISLASGLVALAAAGPLAALAAETSQSRAGAASTPAQAYIRGAFEPEFEPPAPGTYALPVVDTVRDHHLVDSEGARVSLFEAKKGRVAILAFIYTACGEASGCPLATAVLRRVDRALGADPDLAPKVALLTVSFDPERDTPEHLALVRRAQAPMSTWRFLTGDGDEELQALLEDFNQPVARLTYPDGAWSGLFRHLLKVYLLDTQDRVRNIYSVGFLNPALLLNDVRTLLMQEEGVSSEPRPDGRGSARD